MEMKNINFGNIAIYKRVFKFVIYVFIVWLTMWLCNNLPELLKKLLK